MASYTTLVFNCLPVRMSHRMMVLSREEERRWLLSRTHRLVTLLRWPFNSATSWFSLLSYKFQMRITRSSQQVMA